MTPGKRRIATTHVGLREFTVHLDRRASGGIDVDVNLDVAAVNTISQGLAQALFIEVETVWKAELQIQEAVVDAFHADADGPAILFAACLGVAGH
jgi:hypothetical protein